MRKIGRLMIVATTLLYAGCSLGRGGEQGVSPAGLTPSEWASLSQPGPSHKLMNMFAGEWDATISVWSGPHAKPEVSKGRSSIRWVLGNRFLQEDFQGQTAGESLQGMGLMGYDNGARQFKTVWIDSLNTALAVSSGRFVADRNVFEMTSEVYDPLIGGVKKVRSTLQIASPNEYKYSMVDTAPNGKEFTSFEIIYTRRS